MTREPRASAAHARSALSVLVAFCVAGCAEGYGLWAVEDNATAPTSFFYSRPDINAPALDLTVYDEAAITPGHISVAPWRRVESGPDPGPYIYVNSGNLIWSGADHLYVFQGASHVGFARGVGLILDSMCQIVKVVQAGGSTAGAGAGAGAGDMHEFRLVDDGRRALVTVYQVAAYDLSPFGLVGDGGVGWIVEGAFQEIRVDDGAVLFEWRSLDHDQTSPRRGRVLPGGTPVGGTGRLPAAPWDYFHINSVDKNADGDYLVSARHTSTSCKISGERGGAVEWRLCGQDEDEGGGRSTTPHTHDDILLDNAFDGCTAPAARPNSNETTGAMLSGSQGNLQLLPNGNACVGWGIWPFFSGHSGAAGATLLWGEVAHDGSNVTDYRARKFDWSATAHDCPTLFAYSLDGHDGPGGTAMYVSRNGATGVDTWNFYVGDAADGPWRWAGWANRSGFETRWRWANCSAWSFAEAVDADGAVVRRSGVVATFVPSERLRASAACDVWGCKVVAAAAAAVDGGGGDGELVVEPETVRPEDVDWDGVGYRVGFEGVEHYPPQPPRRFLSLAWQIGPQIALAAAVFVFVVFMWLSTLWYRKLGRVNAKGKYRRAGGKDVDCEEGAGKRKDEVCDCEECSKEPEDEDCEESSEYLKVKDCEDGRDPLKDADCEENGEELNVESVKR